MTQGLLDNVPRMLPADVIALVDVPTSKWTLPPVFKWLQSLANLPQDELLRTFNCGLGMVLAVESETAPKVISILEEYSRTEEFAGYAPLVLGTVIPRDNVNASQVKVIGEVL